MSGNALWFQEILVELQAISFRMRQVDYLLAFVGESLVFVAHFWHQIIDLEQFIAWEFFQVLAHLISHMTKGLDLTDEGLILTDGAPEVKHTFSWNFLPPN